MLFLEITINPVIKKPLAGFLFGYDSKIDLLIN